MLQPPNRGERRRKNIAATRAAASPVGHPDIYNTRVTVNGRGKGGAGAESLSTIPNARRRPNKNWTQKATSTSFSDAAARAHPKIGIARAEGWWPRPPDGGGSFFSHHPQWRRFTATSAATAMLPLEIPLSLELRLLALQPGLLEDRGRGALLVSILRDEAAERPGLGIREHAEEGGALLFGDCATRLRPRRGDCTSQDASVRLLAPIHKLGGLVDRPPCLATGPGPG